MIPFSMYRKFVLPLFLAMVWPEAAWAYRTLDQVQYLLYKEPSASVEKDLRELSKRGDLAAKAALADLLSLGPAASAKEALVLYQEAFANGRGQVTALGGLARLLKRHPRMRAAHANYMRQAVKMYPHKQSPRSVNTTLEVFLVYPEFFTTHEINQLIDMYQNSCIVFCRPQLYKAMLAEQNGDLETADRMYREAIWLDTRAVTLYYDFMGEAQDDLFPVFARKIVDYRDRLPVETVHNVATLLDTIYSTHAGLIAISNRQRYAAIDLMPEGAAKEEALDALEADKLKQKKQENEANIEVRGWLDNAVERGWGPAMVTKVNYMATWSKEYTGEEAASLIERIGATDPQQAKALYAHIYQVADWGLTLAPYKSYALIQELIADNYRNGQQMLAHLYSRGGLDESDQEKALEILYQQAHTGAPSAFIYISNIYYNGNSFCQNIVDAYAYANAAKLLGEFRSRGMLKRFTKEMTEDQLRQAFQRSQEIIEEYGL